MTTKKLILTILFLFFLSNSFAQRLITIDSAGQQLKRFYLDQHVDSLWITGHHVNWETGLPDEPNAKIDIGSHCSAFVASVCKQNGVYILRPPAHDTELLANAQYIWLHSADALALGWKQITQNSLETAQRLADSGIMVVAVYKNPNPNWSGHIAFVIPAEIITDSIAASGPILIQAGRTNSNYITFKQVFGRQIKKWPPTSREIAFFYYDIRKK
jgi:hypothetical protein